MVHITFLNLKQTVSSTNGNK